MPAAALPSRGRGAAAAAGPSAAASASPRTAPHSTGPPEPTGHLAAQLGAAPPSPERAEAFAAVRPKSVIELQQWRDPTTVSVPGPTGPRLTASFVNLNPWINEWYVVQLSWPDGQARTYHLENPSPRRVKVVLDPAWPEGLVLSVDGKEERCSLWSAEGGTLEVARTSGRAYAPICSDRLALRNPMEGRRSKLEWTTDFLRDKVWGGEQITNLVKETLYKDSELATSELIPDGGAAEARARDGLPARPQLDPAVVGDKIVPVNLGLPLLDAGSGTLELGRWYAVEGSPGVFISAVEPRYVDPALTEPWGDRVRPLDPVEASALTYVVAFDLDSQSLRFDLGTHHPRVDWSARVPAAVRDSRLEGPDGFGTLAPLVRTGQVNPANVPRLVATFTGGFKRSHGAFRSGELSLLHSGSHYGWAEHGVIESKLQPGLATTVVWADGTVDVKVWQPEDDARLWAVRSARQNGVPLLQPDPETGLSVPGALVTRWGDGNWSGSAEGELRSVRASLCVQEGDQGRFLLYSWFSSATPSAMARVLGAYGCGTGMLTDMNALEHTYLSLHHFQDGVYTVHHLIQGMEVLDKERRGTYLPRFVGIPDNRDFFTILRGQP